MFFVVERMGGVGGVVAMEVGRGGRDGSRGRKRGWERRRSEGEVKDGMIRR